MQSKSGAEHLQSLKDGRTVYIDGKLVDDVTTHPAYRNAVASAAHLYDYQARPENIDLMTFMPEGGTRRVNRCWQMPRNYDELVQRRKALQAWAQVSYGFMGRSPDHVASTMIGQFMGLDVFRKHGPARAKALADYVDYATRNDLFLTYVIVNPQADRSKDWGSQAEELVAQIVDEDTTGLTIRGAKMLGTSAIMANEVFVANTPSHVLQNYQAHIRLSVKMKFLVGLAHKITEAIGTTNMPQVREQLGVLAAYAGMVDAMLCGMEASGAKRGEFYVPNRNQLYSAQVFTQDIYPRLVNLIRDLAGGSLIMLPSSFRDWANPELEPILHKTQRSPNFNSEDKVKLLKAVWDAIGSEFGSRHTQYEMFYSGARFVTTSRSYGSFDWGAARGMVDHLLSTYDLRGGRWDE